MFNVLITGATGMVGKGVLLECIDNSAINSITLISRTEIDIKSPKIKEILLKDFMELDTITSQLKNIDAVFHCMGVSSASVSEEQFSRLTYILTKKLTDVCYAHNPKLTFNYVSGAGTDSSENGRTMWARVKGKTENYILAKGFRRAYMFRPGAIIPERGVKSRTKLYARIYAIMRPFFPLLKKMSNITTTTKIGQAMIKTVTMPKLEQVYFENKDINKLSEA